MSVFDNIKNTVQDHLDKKKEQREFEERLRFEAEIEKRRMFEDRFREHAREAARIQAEREAYSKSGLKKLQATNRALRMMGEPDEAGSNVFSRLKEYTQKNIARREQNLARTEKMREAAEQIKKERMAGRVDRARKPFEKRW